MESSLQGPFLTELCCMTTDLFLDGEPRWEKIIVVQFAKTFFQQSDQMYVIREARTCKDSARAKSAGFLGQPERETLASGHSGQPLRAGNSTDSEETQNGTVRTQEWCLQVCGFHSWPVSPQKLIAFPADKGLPLPLNFSTIHAQI